MAARTARVLAAIAAGAAALPPLLPTHPRCMLTPARADELRVLVRDNGEAAAFMGRVRAQGAYLLTVKPFPPATGPLAIPNVRPILQRLYSLGVLYRVDGNVTWADRAIPELMNAVAAAQWDINGSATLNTGEMLHAVGVGYDWLHDALTPAQRATVVAGAVALGLNNIRAALGPAPPSWSDAFINTPSNWNAVVLGGAIVAALALAGEPGAPPWLGDELLPAALAGIQPSLADLGPGSGANREGPNYHGYLVRAGLAPAAASALSATGGASDGGLLPPGARAAPAYALYTMAPTHPVAQFHYYADTHATPEAVTQYLFLARHFNDSAMAAGFRALGLATADDPRSAAVTAMNAPFAVLFFTAAGGPADVAALPRARAFPEVHAVTSRSSWADANATFIAWKGSNVSWAWAHAHLDGGSFVFATQGQWFAQELGSDSYSSPDYFGKGRFKLYRTNASGHNTIGLELTRGRGVANPHCVPAIAKYVSNCTEVRQEVFVDGGGGGGAWDTFAVVNLTAAYADAGYLAGGGRLARGFVVASNRTALLVVDEAVVPPAARADVTALRWALHTVANVTLAPGGRAARLATWNTTAVVTVSLLPSSRCDGAAFAAAPLRLPPPADPTPGVTLLTLTADPGACDRIVVSVGADAGALAGADPRPLAAWGDGGGPFAPGGGPP